MQAFRIITKISDLLENFPTVVEICNIFTTGKIRTEFNLLTTVKYLMPLSHEKETSFFSAHELPRYNFTAAFSNWRA